MRKLLLLASLVFTVYYGSSLWMFSTAESYTVVANYLPLALLVIMFIIGLLHIRIALCISTVLVLLFGNPALLNTVAINVFYAPAGFNFFTSLGNPIESIILGMFSAWILVRFFGNPDLDYEVNRARAVRALHFPLFIFGLTAVFSALYAILVSNNIFYGTFWEQVRSTLFSYPFAFFKGNNILFPVRSVIYLLEGIAVYVMVVNEIRSARQARALVWILLSGAVAVVIIGYLQRRWGVCYTDRVWQYNKEIQSTFSDPNTLAVFFLAMLPACVALLYRSITSKVLATVFGLLLLGGIVMTATKSIILLAGIFVLVAFIITLMKAVRGQNYVPTILLGIILLLPVIAYLICKPLEGDSNADDLATKYVQKIDGTFGAFFTGKWTLKDLNDRSNYKISDWITAINMVNPDSEQGRNNLLIGVGYGKFRSEYRTYQPQGMSAGRSRMGASNMYLHTLAENGIFSALALLIISLGAIIYALKAADNLEHPTCVKGLAVMLLLLVAGCMTENAFMHIQLQFVFWMIAGLCMVASSLAAGEAEVKGSAVLNILLLLLVLSATIWVVYPLVIKDKEDYATIVTLSEEYSEPPYNIPETKLQTSLEKTGDYNFNRNRLGRWSQKDGLVMTHVTNDIMSTLLGCSHPDCSPDKPVTAEVSINGVTIKQVTFEKFPEQKICEADITQKPELVSLVEDQKYVLVRISVNRTWIPAEHYPQLTNDTFEVGVNVTPISWRDTFSPVPEPPKTEPPVTLSNAVKKTTGVIKDTVEDTVSAIQGTVETAGDAVNAATGKVKEGVDSSAATTEEAVSKTAEKISDATEEKSVPPSGDVDTPFGTIKNTPAEQ